ncbi:Tubulin-tyrosine ligase/Tubulin polyglutamylase [Carpediemonas membranifera]|uniref:Tubulin-tyrosine ligase/Tubulin polyglutamylase n=1 Tax=Carpediemonas membranifera TaxID=201153 RepID=A0A8J6B2P4_9EUKA|nr:Tubulin-tyrosine ligase/Tubulin polyglutamylase [Carpediemonas membranifera]|eukprot:KAG9391697.1 Tubulin-tyrosine ligase/Tubulin polyglutamylase [Carpediemonas membranifera]
MNEEDAVQAVKDEKRSKSSHLSEDVAEKPVKPSATVGPSQMKPKKRRPRPVTICLDACRYEVLRNICKERRWRVVPETDEFSVFWSDLSVAPERLLQFKPYQRANHFVGMTEISRKDGLSKSLNRIAKKWPEEYTFYPQSWTLPIDLNDFRNTHRTLVHKRRLKPVYISKPTAGCQGNGIFLFKSENDIDPSQPQVVQRYIADPHLIDGYKYDLRIYLLVTSVEPLRMFIYKKGMARFATAPYVEPKDDNIKNSFMHLTNYSLNKRNKEGFVSNQDMDHDDEGSKRSLESVWRVLKSEGADVDQIWAQIKDIFIKTVVAIQPTLAHMYRSSLPNDRSGHACFELLGMDILLDSTHTPWLIEVNHSPSFNIDSPLDSDLKHSLIRDTIELLGVTPGDKARYMAEERRRFQERMMPGYSHRDAMRRMNSDEERARIERWEEDTLPRTQYEMIFPNERTEFYEQMMVEKGYSVIPAGRRLGITHRVLKAPTEGVLERTTQQLIQDARVRAEKELSLTERFDQLSKTKHVPTRPVGLKFDNTTVFRAGKTMTAPKNFVAVEQSRNRLVERSGIRSFISRMQGTESPRVVRTEGRPRAFLPYLEANKRMCRRRTGTAAGRPFFHRSLTPSTGRGLRTQPVLS